jgi:hypothetical protein
MRKEVVERKAKEYAAAALAREKSEKRRDKKEGATLKWEEGYRWTEEEIELTQQWKALHLKGQRDWNSSLRSHKRRGYLQGSGDSYMSTLSLRDLALLLSKHKLSINTKASRLETFK